MSVFILIFSELENFTIIFRYERIYFTFFLIFYIFLGMAPTNTHRKRARTDTEGGSSNPGQLAVGGGEVIYLFVIAKSSRYIEFGFTIMI